MFVVYIISMVSSCIYQEEQEKIHLLHLPRKEVLHLFFKSNFSTIIITLSIFITITCSFVA